MGFKWRFRRARCWQGYGFGTTAAGDAGIAGRGTVLGPPRPETLARVRFWDQHGRKRWQGHGHGDMVLHTHTQTCRQVLLNKTQVFPICLWKRMFAYEHARLQLRAQLPVQVKNIQKISILIYFS